MGKQYLVKKCTLPWESNPGPTPIRGDTATLIASVGLKKLVAIDFFVPPWSNGAWIMIFSPQVNFAKEFEFRAEESTMEQAEREICRTLR